MDLSDARAFLVHHRERGTVVWTQIN
jgi:hypothetical protein